MEMARRCVSSATGVTNTQLISGNCMGMDALLDLTSGIAKVPLYIDDTSALTLMEIRAKARRLILKYGIKLFVVDYLQIMGGVNKKGQSREQEVSEFSRGLKSIAKDLDVPFIVLSQLNRECESRPDKKPRLSGLEGLGGYRTGRGYGFIALPSRQIRHKRNRMRRRNKYRLPGHYGGRCS